MGMFDDLLSRRKKEEEMKSENRLPPGQSLTEKFPILTYGPTPKFDPATWDLRVFGEVEKEMRWTWDEFLALPTTTVTTDIHCVTRWSKFDTTWEGVPFTEFVKLFGLKDNARYVIAHCDYGYTTNLPLETMMDDDVMLASFGLAAPGLVVGFFAGILGLLVGLTPILIPMGIAYVLLKRQNREQ